MNYEKLLNYQPMLNPKVRSLVEQLQDGSLTKTQVNSRKYYAKSKNDLLTVVEYSIAFDIVSMLSEDTL